MKISITNEAADRYTLQLGETSVTLDANELNHLSKEISRFDQNIPSQDNESPAQHLKQWLEQATDVDIQTFLHRADHDDVVIFIKVSEQEQSVLDRIYNNMSAKSQRIFSEDVAYKYKQHVPATEIEGAIPRMDKILSELKS